MPVSSSLSHALTFKQGDILPPSAESLWRIDEGFVRTLTWNDEGDLITLGVWGDGDVVGRPLSQIKPFQMECLTAVQVEPLSPTQNHVQEAMCFQVRCMEEFLSIIGYKRAPLRLLKFLQWLAQRFGRDVDQGRMLDLRLTHQLLADITGITRVTATRLLKQFEEEGRLTRLKKHRILLKEALWQQDEQQLPAVLKGLRMDVSS
ncbi:MAG: Crp/Fnr family transcriptional regulator [Thermosynechococcaceae cyanobacterium]